MLDLLPKSFHNLWIRQHVHSFQLKSTQKPDEPEKPRWTDHEIEENQPELERSRQAIIQHFPDWLGRQAPEGATLDAAGDFKRKMLRLIGGNLKKLGLDDLYQVLERHTSEAIRQVETAAEARQLIRDVQLWLTSNGDARRFVRVAELRDLRQMGKEYASKLQGLSMRIQIPEIGQTRSLLSDALARMKDVEEGITERVSKLWKSKLRSEDDLDRLLEEVNALTGAFENCPTSDLEDLQLMRRALRIYQSDYQHLHDERLTWPEFETLAGNCTAEAKSALGDDEIPWPPEEAITGFVTIISKRRKEASSAWIASLKAEAANLAILSAADANRLHARAGSPPAILTQADAKHLVKIVKDVESRLDNLKIDWLVEKFKELSPAMRRRFLHMISESADG